MGLYSALTVFSDQYCHNRTVTPSINSLLVSYLCRPFGAESGDRASSLRSLSLSSSSHPSLSLSLSANHVDARLFGLKVLYLYFPFLATCCMDQLT